MQQCITGHRLRGIEIHQGTEGGAGPLHRRRRGSGPHRWCSRSHRAQPVECLGNRHPVRGVPHTSFIVVEIEESNMIITTVFVFVVAAALVTWYVTTH